MACYILAKLQKTEDEVIISPVYFLVDMQGLKLCDVEKVKVSPAMKHQISIGLDELVSGGYIKAYPYRLGHDAGYRIVANDLLREYNADSRPDSVGTVYWEDIVKIFSSVKKRITRTFNVILAYLFLITHTYDHYMLSPEMKGKFVVMKIHALGEYLTHGTYSYPRTCNRGREICDELERIGILRKYNMHKYLTVKPHTSLKTFYAIRGTSEDAEAFINWLMRTFYEVKPSFLAPPDRRYFPKFKFRAETYHGYPARLIKDYQGSDPDFLALREQMIKEWTY